ncbi:MAG TPA: hypothetical protein VHE35_13920, partial [Kofleriaceae bacterium]|nr:hypothetical protein [Kofleriaceae bacterium]
EGSRLPPRAFALFGYGARVLSRSAGLGQFPTAAGLSRFTRFLATTDSIALMWWHKLWSHRTRVIATVASATLFTAAMISSQHKKDSDKPAVEAKE